MSAPDEHPVEVWTFAGERLGSDGKSRVHVWIDSAGAELLFKARSTPYSIGSRYAVPVERRDDGGVTMFGTMFNYVGRVEERHADKLIVWQAADAAAKTRQANRRREARESKLDDPLGRALDELRMAARRQRTAADRAAFIGHVIEQLSRAW